MHSLEILRDKPQSPLGLHVIVQTRKKKNTKRGKYAPNGGRCFLSRISSRRTLNTGVTIDERSVPNRRIKDTLAYHYRIALFQLLHQEAGCKGETANDVSAADRDKRMELRLTGSISSPRRETLNVLGCSCGGRTFR